MPITEELTARAKVQSIFTSTSNGKHFSLVFFKIQGECIPIEMIANGLTKKQVLHPGERVKVKYMQLDHKIKMISYTKNNGKSYRGLSLRGE